MAGFWERFGKRWSATGVVAEPTAIQSDTGFSFLGASPPTVEQFNALLQNLDDKDNWIYVRISEVLVAGGITPSAATPNQLLTALRTLFQPGMAAFTGSAAFVVPAGVTRIKARLWGGGGGGGGSQGINSAGSGGAGGGHCEGLFSVTPGSSIFITVGSGGIGSGTGAIYSATAGGATSLGSLCSATGGGPGAGGLNAIAFSGGAPGIGIGGLINLPGEGGGFGQNYLGGAAGGGLGGGVPFGANPSPLSIGASGNNGNFPGGGATGAGMAANAASNFSFNGGNGAPGFAVVTW